MNFLFNPENKFWRFMDKITDLVLIMLLWALCSIPIITMGAATTALYQFTLKQTDDEEGYVFRSFRKAFARNFKQATILWVIVLAVGAFLLVDLYACLNIAMPSAVRLVCFAFIICLGFMYLLTAIYLFPILSRFHHSIRTILRHSFIMAIGNLYMSVTILVMYVLFGVLFYFWPSFILVWIGLAVFFSSYLLRSVFRRYQQEEGAQ